MERFTGISKKFSMIFKNYLFYLFFLFLSFICSANIINDKFQDNNVDQTPLIPEQMIFSLNPSTEEKSLMNKYVLSDNIDDHRKIHKSCRTLGLSGEDLLFVGKLAWILLILHPSSGNDK